MTRSDIEDLILSENELVVIETYKGRLQILGEAPSGRVLSVILGPDRMGEPGAFYVFSARPASRQERRFFANQQEGQHL
jgi:hypothetical protein